MTLSGIHLSLDRERAKQVFAQKSEAGLRQAVLELLAESDGAPQIATSGTLWPVLHRCLSDGTLEPSGGEMPLNQCILGGRPLPSPPGQPTVLVRPDLVTHVGAALDGLDEAWLGTQLCELPDGAAEESLSAASLWECLQRIRALFQSAARNRNAVLFAVLPDK